MLLLLPVPFAAQVLSPRDVDELPASAPSLTSHYGPGAHQFGDLRLPVGEGPFPVAVIVHGGCWTNGYATLRNTTPLASDLTSKGIATWNIEYRQAGDRGGGWPGTFVDWANATDHLRELAKTQPLDLDRVVAIGHSAGAHGALWISARHHLPAASELASDSPLPIAAAIAIDGPYDLGHFSTVDADICGKPVIAPLLGGTIAEQPQRYRETSLLELMPFDVPQHLVSSSVVLPLADARQYRDAILARGGVSEIVVVPGDTHFNVIAPGQAEFVPVAELIERTFAGLKKTTATDTQPD